MVKPSRSRLAIEQSWKTILRSYVCNPLRLVEDDTAAVHSKPCHRLRTTFFKFALIAAFLVLAHGTFAQPASSWRAFKNSDGLAESPCQTVSVSPQGHVLVTHPHSNSVSVLDGYSVRKISLPEIVQGRIAQGAGGQLWAVTTNGLVEFKNDRWILHRVPEIAAEFQNQFRNATNFLPLYPLRQSRVLFLLHDRLMEFNSENPDQLRVEIVRNAAQSQIGFFSSVTVARDGGLWIGGERGLAHLAGPTRNLSTKSEWNEFILPSELDIKNILAPEADEEGGVIALAESRNGQNAMVRFDGKSWRVIAWRDEKILWAWRGANPSFWAATSTGLFRISENDSRFVPAKEFLPRQIFDVAVEPNGVFWLATSDGLFRHAAPLWREPENEELSREAQANSESPELSANSFTARNGDVWLSDERGVARVQNEKRQTFPQSDKNIPDYVVAFAELIDGKMIAATTDKLWEFDGMNWSSIRAGFVGINALLCSRDGTLWVATENGVHRLVSGGWIENNLAEGLPSADVRQLREDQLGRIWAETTLGWAQFHPEADTDAPRTFITGLNDEKGRVREGESLVLKLSAEDRWKFTPRDRLLFSHRLDEREWSAFSESDEVALSDLAPGKHYFQARAMDRNGNTDANPARLEFIVTVPWYKEARLIVIAFAGMAVALFFAGVAVNRHRRLKLSYAEVEKKIAERTRELEIANRELLHSQKMNALGTIAAGIAHDFNNILSIIKGSTQIIDENLDNPEKVRTRLDRIKTVVQQGAGIVEAMLGFSRSSDERAVPCDINAVVADTLTLLGERFGREVEVKFECDDDLPEVSVARDLVQQILLNFVFNAAESMDGRKQVILTTRQIESLHGGTILLPTSSKSYLTISVKDFGCGISPENLPRVFEPFFTTKALSTRRGTGLGLSMVYELAKKLEAGLSVESVLGKGSTFTLVLPVRTLTEISLSRIREPQSTAQAL